MADKKLQKLKRAWHESGSHQDELAYLKERRAQGKIDIRHLLVAKRCDHEVSRLLVGSDDSSTQDPNRTAFEEAREWVSKFEYDGKSFETLVAIVCGVHVYRYHELYSKLVHWQALEAAINLLLCKEVHNLDQIISRMEEYAENGSENLYSYASYATYRCLLAATEDGDISDTISAADSAIAASQAFEIRDLKGRAGIRKARSCSKKIWRSDLKPAICSVMIKAVLYGWRDYESLLPPRPNE